MPYLEFTVFDLPCDQKENVFEKTFFTFFKKTELLL